jgi:hypothetical protein
MSFKNRRERTQDEAQRAEEPECTQ